MAAGGTAGARAPAPLGLVDGTITRELARDYGGTLKAVAALGYTHFGFRLAGYGGLSGELPAAEKARLVRAAGMQVGVVRFGIGRNVTLADQVPLAVATGAKIVALSAAPPFFAGGQLGQATRATFEAWLPELAALSRACRSAGLTLAYHNHWWDVMPLRGGETPLAILARRFSPAELAFEVDLAWSWYGGTAPLELLDKLGPRVVSLHLKDIDRARGMSITDHATVIGSGEMAYAALLPRLRQATRAIGYVEVDTPGDGMAAAAQGAHFFRTTLGEAA